MKVGVILNSRAEKRLYRAFRQKVERLPSSKRFRQKGGHSFGGRRLSAFPPYDGCVAWLDYYKTGAESR
jgi:hypothetical protein